jgi:hypothetical protein
MTNLQIVSFSGDILHGIIFLWWSHTYDVFVENGFEKNGVYYVTQDP